LALCNFEGNENVLIEEFISKCQSKYLWMVIKQNLTVILRSDPERYGVDKEQFLTERAYDTSLLSKFNKEAI